MLPHRDLGLCAVLHLAFHFLQVYCVERRPLPDFRNASANGWKDHYVFPGKVLQKGKPGCYNPISSTTNLKHMRKCIASSSDGEGLQLLKVTETIRGGHNYFHSIRNTVASDLRRDGCTDEQVGGVLWDVPNSTLMNMAYQRRGTPAAAVCRSGFLAHEQRSVVLDYLDMEAPPDDVVRRVFLPMQPFEELEHARRLHRDSSTTSKQIDYSLENVLEVMCFMAILVVRSMGAGIMRTYPDSSIWRLPFVNDARPYIQMCESTGQLSKEACEARHTLAFKTANAGFRILSDEAKVAHQQSQASLMATHNLAVSTHNIVQSLVLQRPGLLPSPLASGANCIPDVLPPLPVGPVHVPAMPQPAAPHTPLQLRAPSVAAVTSSPQAISPRHLASHGNSIQSLVAEWFDGDNPLKDHKSTSYRRSLLEGFEGKNRSAEAARLRNLFCTRSLLMANIAPDGERPSAESIAEWQQRVEMLPLHSRSISGLLRSLRRSKQSTTEAAS